VRETVAAVADGSITSITSLVQGTTVLVNDTDSLHYSHTYLFDTPSSSWIEIAGPAAVVLPANQIAYGTGTGIASDANLTWDNVTTTLAVNGYEQQSQGNFASSGDAVTRQYVLRATTVGAATSEMLIDGVSRMTLTSDSTWRFEIHVVGRRTDADNESAAYEIKGCIDNNAGTTALVGTASHNVTAEDTVGWDVVASADNVNDALVINVTGTVGTIRWVAFVRTVQVTG
jgi:hypothetical protein